MGQIGQALSNNFKLQLTGGTIGTRIIQNFSASGSAVEHGYLNPSTGEIVAGITQSTVYGNPDRTYLVNVYVPYNSEDENILEKIVDQSKQNGVQVFSGVFNDYNKDRSVASPRVIVKEAANATINADGNDARMFTIQFADSVVVTTPSELTG